jgi:hypothetical protein
MCDLLQYYKIKIIPEAAAMKPLRSTELENRESAWSLVIITQRLPEPSILPRFYHVRRESIMAALDRAVEICQSYHTIQVENQVSPDILLWIRHSSTFVMSETDRFPFPWEGGESDVVYDSCARIYAIISGTEGAKFFII